VGIKEIVASDEWIVARKGEWIVASCEWREDRLYYMKGEKYA
jgi:hypothetical protein